MADISDDAYLLEVMASHAALAFRPDPPKTACRCNCEEKIDALTEAFAKGENLAKGENRPQGGALALGAGCGAVAGAVITFLIRKRI